MAYIKSNENQKSELKRTFVPTKIELAVLPIVSLVVLLLLNALQAIKSVDGGQYVLVPEYIQGYVQKILEPTNSQFGNTFFTFVFWMVIGILTYMLIWVISTLLVAYKNDKPWNGHMVLPNNFNKDKAGHEILTRFLVRTLALLALLTWSYLFLTKLFPNVSSSFLDNMTDFNIVSLIKIIYNVVSLSVFLYVFSILTRFVLLRSRVFEFN